MRSSRSEVPTALAQPAWEDHWSRQEFAKGASPVAVGLGAILLSRVLGSVTSKSPRRRT